MTSPARKPRRNRPVPMLMAYATDRLTLTEAVTKAARASGCTCEPEIVPREDGLRVTVHHDDTCGLLRQADVN